MITPVFTQISPLCQFSTPPALPASSANSPAITGTWNPATINTSSPGTTTYTFTPSAGQCATSATMNIVVNPQITPVFTQISPLCQNSTPPALPASSANSPAITGTWNPATINTAGTGTTTYTFTPSAGQCATSATMNIVVNPQSHTSLYPDQPVLPKLDITGITYQFNQFSCHHRNMESGYH